MQKLREISYDTNMNLISSYSINSAGSTIVAGATSSASSSSSTSSGTIAGAVVGSVLGAIALGVVSLNPADP